MKLYLQRKTDKLGEKLVLVPLCPTDIPEVVQA
jgi:hypothetical protein